MAGRPNHVIVVGGGPTGLTLAGELALAGVPCRVLTDRDAQGGHSAAACLQARSLELLDLRGQAAAFTDAGLPLHAYPLGPAGSVVDLRGLDSDFGFYLDIHRDQVESLLETWATGLGAEVVRPAAVVGVEQDDGEVRLTVEGASGTRVERASYVVACDGAGGSIREALGLPFPGIEDPGASIVAEVRGLDGLPADSAYGDVTETGLVLVFPFPDGSARVVLYDHARADQPAGEPVTVDEVRESLARVTGRSDLRLQDLVWAELGRGASRQAEDYRIGRIFLAGSAAHSHSPASALDLDIGIQDAVNLGWKLAGTVKGWAPDWLLDSYHAERHPAARDLLALTGRLLRLNTAQQGRVRWAIHRLLAPLPPVQNRLARAYSGLAVAYPPATSLFAGQQGHPLAGTRLPRGVLTLPGGSRTRLYDLFHDGKFVLLDRDVHAERYGGLPPHVRTVPFVQCDRPRWPAAMLVRPDGYIAWANTETDPALRAPMVRQAIRAMCSPVTSKARTRG